MIVVVAVAVTARALGGAAGVVDSVRHIAAELVADLIVAAGGSQTAS